MVRDYSAGKMTTQLHYQLGLRCQIVCKCNGKALNTDVQTVLKDDTTICCGGQVIPDSEISFFGVDSRSKAWGDMLPSFECSLMLL